VTDLSDDPVVGLEEVAALLGGLPKGPIAVTGGTGFVGSHLVETLCQGGRRPRVLVRNPEEPRWIGSAPVEWVAGSLEAVEPLERLVDGAELVLHLAGVVRASSQAAFDAANRDGTARLVDAVNRRAARSCRAVTVSSLAAAGPSPDINGVSPTDPARPVSQYGRSKLAGEQTLVQLRQDVASVIVRPPAIYGPRDTDIFEFFRMANAGLVPVPAGERWITVAWVGDVVRWVLAAGSGCADGEVLHVGEPTPYLLTALVRLLAAAGGRRARIVPVPTAVMRTAGAAGGLLHKLGARRTALTPDKVRELTARHWTARTEGSLKRLGTSQVLPFEDGAAWSWQWYRRHGWLGYHERRDGGRPRRTGR
jgi:nucleoside-diphosphate-sugar epimerase